MNDYARRAVLYLCVTAVLIVIIVLHPGWIS